jgi:hypothetical protein
MEWGATRIAVAIQAAAANVDLEVLSLPGGSVFAVVLWLCETVVTGVGRRTFRYRTLDKRSPVALHSHEDDLGNEMESMSHDLY